MESDFIKSVNFQEYSGNYHDEKEYISASGLKKLKISPMHFKEMEKVEETDAMIFGSAYHCFILEPQKFDSEFYIFDDMPIYEVLIGEGFKSPRSTKQYKEWAENEAMTIGDRKSISIQEFESIKKMKERLFNHFYTKSLLTNGRAEIGYTGTIDTIFGEINVKFKPDYIKDARRLIVDLKTCQDASIDGFSRSAAEYDMHIQASFYADLLSKIEGEGQDFTFIFIAQEKKAPYAFNLFEASNQFISQGRYEYEHLLQLYKFCQDNNRWPGYQIFCQNKYGINELKLPPWAIKSLDFYDHNYSLNTINNGNKLASSN